MILHLLRHAKTEKFAVTGKDYDRPLASKGILQAENLKLALANTITKNVEVHVSAANRTQETAKTIFPEYTLHFCKELYLASSQELLQYINQLSTSNDLFLIGHNEGLSELATSLIGENILLKTASYLAITFDCKNSAEISRHNGTILHLYRPEIMS